MINIFLTIIYFLKIQFVFFLRYHSPEQNYFSTNQEGLKHPFPIFSSSSSSVFKRNQHIVDDSTVLLTVPPNSFFFFFFFLFFFFFFLKIYIRKFFPFTLTASISSLCFIFFRNSAPPYGNHDRYGGFV